MPSPMDNTTSTSQGASATDGASPTFDSGISADACRSADDELLVDQLIQESIEDPNVLKSSAPLDIEPRSLSKSDTESIKPVNERPWTAASIEPVDNRRGSESHSHRGSAATHSKSQSVLEDLLRTLLRKTDETNSRIATLEQTVATHCKNSNSRLVALERRFADSSSKLHPSAPSPLIPPAPPTGPSTNEMSSPPPLGSDCMTNGDKTDLHDAQKNEDAPLPPSIPGEVDHDNPKQEDESSPNPVGNDSIATPSAKPSLKRSSTASMAGSPSKKAISGSLQRQATSQRLQDANRLEMFVRHDSFSYFFGVAIIVNSVCIGAQADFVAQNPRESIPDTYRHLETFFCLLFLLELVLRVVVERREFIYTLEWKWNVFDVLIVTLAVIEEIFKLANNSQDTNFTGIRVLRVLRVVRIIRLVRVLHAFRELRVLINSILGSMVSLMWTILLLFVIKYIAAVYLAQVVAEHRVEYDADSVDEAHAEDLQAMEDMYGSVMLALYSLYQAMSGGADWGDVASPLVNRISGLFAPVFCMYIAFAVFAVLNVVTGVFVNEAMIMASKDQELAIQEELSREGSEIEDFSRMFHEADEDGDGLVTWAELEVHLDDPRVKAYFKALNLDVAEAQMLFRLLDLDGSGEISVDEFVGGCVKVKGQAKGIDLHCLRYETMRVSKQLQKVSDRLGIVEAKRNGVGGDEALL